MLGRNRNRYWERLLNYLERILAPKNPSPLQWTKSSQVHQKLGLGIGVETDLNVSLRARKDLKEQRVSYNLASVP